MFSSARYLALSLGVAQAVLASPTISIERNAPKQLSYYPPNANCYEYMIPITIESENIQFNFTKWDDNFALLDFLATTTTRPSAHFPSVYGDKVKEKGSHTIAASFCEPKYKSEKASNVIVATHGIGPAREHWNSPWKPETHNFVMRAIDAGNSIFFYDRLGLGHSSRTNGFETQLSHHSAVLTELVGLVKQGKYIGTLEKPNKVAVMSFSFGSYITHDAICKTPDLADVVVLTGFGPDTDNVNANGLIRSFAPRIASIENEKLWGSYDKGYLTSAGIYAEFVNYFKYGSYELATAKWTEYHKIPFAVTEFYTILSGELDASKYEGSTLIITGETDYIICDGFCGGILEGPGRERYPNAKLTTHLVPEASHNFFFHTSAPESFKAITDFLADSDF